jgi:ketosteroid isomerase-like protein
MGADDDRRTAVERHHAASAVGDMDGVHAIYAENVIVEYPQSGERIVGLANLRALRESYPSRLAFTISRIVGDGALWVTEYVISYDGKPVNTVSIMEFDGPVVTRETLYFADPFDPPAWRAEWVEKRQTPPRSA